MVGAWVYLFHDISDLHIWEALVEMQYHTLDMFMMYVCTYVKGKSSETCDCKKQHP